MLRPWRPEDAPSIARHADDPQVAANLRDVFPCPYQLSDAEEFIRLCRAAEPEQAIVRTDTCDILPSNILLSGAELDLNIFANPMVLLIGAVYIASRSLGKISGSYVSCKATRCSEKIQKYLGITLLPQAGVALGMAATAAELSDGHMVRNVVLFSVLVYELVGPTLTKISLVTAGEIRPEGRTSARVENQPEAPVELS